MSNLDAARKLEDQSAGFGGNPGFHPNSLRARHLAWVYAGGSDNKKAVALATRGDEGQSGHDMSGIGSVFLHLRPNVTDNTVLGAGDAITSALIQGTLGESNAVVFSSTAANAPSLVTSALTFGLSGVAGHVALSGVAFFDSATGSGTLSAMTVAGDGFELSANKGCCIMAVIATSAEWDAADADNDIQFIIGSDTTATESRVHFARSVQNANTSGDIGFEDEDAGVVATGKVASVEGAKKAVIYTMNLSAGAELVCNAHVWVDGTEIAGSPDTFHQAAGNENVFGAGNILTIGRQNLSMDEESNMHDCFLLELVVFSEFLNHYQLTAAHHNLKAAYGV